MNSTTIDFISTSEMNSTTIDLISTSEMNSTTIDFPSTSKQAQACSSLEGISWNLGNLYTMNSISSSSMGDEISASSSPKWTEQGVSEGLSISFDANVHNTDTYAAVVRYNDVLLETVDGKYFKFNSWNTITISVENNALYMVVGDKLVVDGSPLEQWESTFTSSASYQ